ncbi:hypothetical protein [Anaerobacillus alkalidiazotrophicus]|nr:hypothetical protein [Anaerobacillus alkalidiazotrophicus]
MADTQYYVLLGLVIFLFITFSLGINGEDEQGVPVEVLPVSV